MEDELENILKQITPKPVPAEDVINLSIYPDEEWQASNIVRKARLLKESQKKERELSKKRTKGGETEHTKRHLQILKPMELV